MRWGNGGGEEGGIGVRQDDLMIVLNETTSLLYENNTFTDIVKLFI